MIRRILSAFLSTPTPTNRVAAQPAPHSWASEASSPAISEDDFFNKKDDKTREKEIDALLARYITRDKKTGKYVTPGAAIMVIKEDRVVYETYKGAARGIGKGEREDTYADITKDAIFDLASVSKQFTAMAIILLKDRRKLNFDDPLSKFFPSEHIPNVSFHREIREGVTVRHLLNHTSGLRDVIELFTKKTSYYPRIHHHFPRSLRSFQEQNLQPNLSQAFEPSSREVLERLSEQDLSFPPGTKWEYSNSGYIILAQIVESITGEHFPDFMKENIFKPLGMNDTFVVDENTPVPPPNRVTSYDRGWNDFHDIDYTPLNKIYGDGNVHTTLRDMRKWDHALQVIFQSEDFPGEKPLVAKASIDEAFGPKNITDLHPAIQYTSGWFFGYYRGGNCKKDLMWHSGGWVGFRTMILRFFTRPRLTVILLANNMYLPASTIACRVAQLFLKEPPTTRQSPLDLERLQQVVENYHLEKDNVLDLNGEDIIYSDDITLEDDKDLWVKDFYLEKNKLMYSSQVSADVNKEKEELKEEDNETPDDAEVFVFYMQDLDGNFLEGFDIFRYDIVGKKIYTRPMSRSKKSQPIVQRGK